jgi:dihydroorotase
VVSNFVDMASLVLRGGRVIDPAAERDEVADVLVEDGRIAAVGREVATPPDASVIDVGGLIVTPGLIDLHVHVIEGLGDFCLYPDRVGVDQAVPTVVDGGTSGAATFGLARKWIDDPVVRTQVLAFMDPCQIYFATKDFICHKLEIANDLRNLDVDLTAATLEANADVIVGMKVRACYVDDPHTSPFLEAAKAVAEERPIMVHLGRFPFTPTISTTDLLHALRPGDVITHAFRGASGVLDGDGKVTIAMRDAVERGLRLDVGHSVLTSGSRPRVSSSTRATCRPPSRPTSTSSTSIIRSFRSRRR